MDRSSGRGYSAILAGLFLRLFFWVEAHRLFYCFYSFRIKIQFPDYSFRMRLRCRRSSSMSEVTPCSASSTLRSSHCRSAEPVHANRCGGTDTTVSPSERRRRCLESASHRASVPVGIGSNSAVSDPLFTRAGGAGGPWGGGGRGVPSCGMCAEDMWHGAKAIVLYMVRESGAKWEWKSSRRQKYLSRDWPSSSGASYV